MFANSAIDRRLKSLFLLAIGFDERVHEIQSAGDARRRSEKRPGVAGTWKELGDSVNSMANNLTAQVCNMHRDSACRYHRRL